MAAEVMAVTVMAVVATCIMGDTVMAGVVTCTMVMVGRAMPITDPLMARVMLAPAADMRIMDMAGGITVTGTPAMVVGGVATTTHTVLVPAGALRPLVGFGSAISPRQFVHEEAPHGGDGASSISGAWGSRRGLLCQYLSQRGTRGCGICHHIRYESPAGDQVRRAEVSAALDREMLRGAAL